jgi:hypothetical protein
VAFHSAFADRGKSEDSSSLLPPSSHPISSRNQRSAWSTMGNRRLFGNAFRKRAPRSAAS